MKKPVIAALCCLLALGTATVAFAEEPTPTPAPELVELSPEETAPQFYPDSISWQEDGGQLLVVKQYSVPYGTAVTDLTESGMQWGGADYTLWDVTESVEGGVTEEKEVTQDFELSVRSADAETARNDVKESVAYDDEYGFSGSLTLQDITIGETLQADSTYMATAHYAGIVTISSGERSGDKSYSTDPTDIASNEKSYTMHADSASMQNDRTLGSITLSKADLDAARYLAAGSNGDSTLEGAVYDLYAAEDIYHPDGVSGIVDYSKITDASGTPIWHTTVLTNGAWKSDYLPVLKKDHLVASAAVKDGKLAFSNLYLGRYYLVERATGIVIPVDSNGQYYLSGKYPLLNKKLEPTGSYAALANNGTEYTDYVYRNQYSAVAESRALDGSKTYDGYYLSFAKGYLCDEVNHYQSLTYADESTYVVRTEDQTQDEVLKSGFSLQKLVSTTGQPSPAIKLGGAGFKVYRVSLLSKADQFAQNADGSYDSASILDAYRKSSYDQDTLKFDFSAEEQAVATMYESDTTAVTGYNATLTADGDFANGQGLGYDDGVIDVEPIRDEDGTLTGLKQSSDADFNARTKEQEALKAEWEKAGITAGSGSFEQGDPNYRDDSLDAYTEFGVSYDKSSNHWMYGEKPIYILYDKEHYTFCDKGVSDGVSLNVVRDKAGNIEKLVSVDKGELEQFVK